MGWEKLATKTYVDNQTHEAALTLIDSDTFAGALSTNVASSESIKAYVDTEVAKGDETLANTKIWIGDSSGDKAEFALSGDVTMTAGGAVTVASSNADFTVGTSLQTATIDFTDGDLAMTIADGGAVTFAQDATFSGAVTSSGVVTGTGFTAGSAVLTEAELEKLDGITNGTVAASKAVVVDANKDIGTLRNLTIDGTFSDGNYTFDTSGNVSGLGTVASGAITSSGVITGTGFTAGSAVLAEAELELLDGITAGTAAASKVVTTDASNNVGSLGTVGSGAITSSGAVQGTSITDGTATMSGGNLASVGTIGSGAISATDLTLSGGDLKYTSDFDIASPTQVTSGVGYTLDISGGGVKADNDNLSGGGVTISGGTSTGTGRGGEIEFKVSPGGVLGTSGGTLNALVTALTISDDKSATFAGTMAVTGTQTFTGAATFSSDVTVAGNLDVQGTTTTIDSANLAVTDPHIMLNVVNDQSNYTAGDSAIIFGHSTNASGGKIVNDAGTGFKFTSLTTADDTNAGTLVGEGSVTAGPYVNAYMSMPVMETLVPGNVTAITGALLFDGTDFYVGT